MLESKNQLGEDFSPPFCVAEHLGYAGGKYPDKNAKQKVPQLLVWIK